MRRSAGLAVVVVAGALGAPPAVAAADRAPAADTPTARASAAAFIRANMPRGITYLDPMLSEQQAWDVATYVNSKPRPPGPPSAK